MLNRSDMCIVGKLSEKWFSGVCSVNRYWSFYINAISYTF